MRRDEGSALIEFLVMTLLLFVPIVYLVIALFSIQGASFAAAGAARDAVRILATSDDPAAAMRSAEASTGLAFADFSVDADHELRVTCESEGCAEPGSRIDVTVSARVPLPLVPSFLTEHAAVSVSAHATGIVDRFRERP